MNLTKYEATGLSRAVDFLESYPEANQATVLEILKTCNLSFILEGITRWQSTMLCEQKESYVQQSQRYVTLNVDGYILPELNEEDREKAKQLIDRAFALYQEMSALKEGTFSGRPKKENYVNGIPIEDARYILPLAVKTNLSVAMTADHLLQWFRMFQRPLDQILFKEVQNALLNVLPPVLGQWLMKQPYIYEETGLLNAYYQDDLDQISHRQPVVLLHAFSALDIKAGLGALTSTKADPPSQVLQNWGNAAAQKAEGVTKRVLSYGHTSIAEQARTTFGMMFSLVTYHQQVRHRLPNTFREPWLNLLLEPERPPVIPQSIIDGGYEQAFRRLVQDMQRFQQKVAGHYRGGLWRPFLLNCQQIKVITSTNARMDCAILRERICNNAQWEIHAIAVKKLEALRGLSKVLYQYAVPGCVYGVCPEGKMTCGHAVEMRAKYRDTEENFVKEERK